MNLTLSHNPHVVLALQIRKMIICQCVACTFWPLNYDYLKMLNSKSLSFNQNEIFERKCQGRAYGKQHRMPFLKKLDHECKQPLELIHTDVCGPMPINSVGGSRYFVTFTNDYTHYTYVYVMKNKSEVIDKLRRYVEMAKNFTTQHVKEFVQIMSKSMCQRELKLSVRAMEF